MSSSSLISACCEARKRVCGCGYVCMRTRLSVDNVLLFLNICMCGCPGARVFIVWLLCSVLLSCVSVLWCPSRFSCAFLRFFSFCVPLSLPPFFSCRQHVLSLSTCFLLFLHFSRLVLSGEGCVTLLVFFFSLFYFVLCVVSSFPFFLSFLLPL